MAKLRPDYCRDSYARRGANDKRRLVGYVETGAGVGKPFTGEDDTLGEGATLGEGNATGVGAGSVEEPGGAVAATLAPNVAVGIGASWELPPHATSSDAARPATPKT
jgi:hypothetical protein